MTTDDLQLLREFRAEMPAPGEETRRRIYAFATSQPKTTLGGRRWSRRQLLLTSATVGVACLASAIIVAHTTAKSSTAPAIRPAAFAVTDNHDGTLAVTLHKRSALAALNLRLARYGLKAKLPTDIPARTLALTATCPKPTFPVAVHGQAGTPGSGQNQVVHQLPHEPAPTEQQRLTNCVLHVNPNA
jgi:hypothetical protein